MTDGWRFGLAGIVFLAVVLGRAYGEHDGFIRVGGDRQFVIGSYAMPESDEDLAAMAEAGVNLVRCRSTADLDRAGAAGMRGWMPLPLQAGVTDGLREQINAAKDHPALAVWEGPDEIVWMFTAYSGLEDRVGVSREDWWSQRPNAVAYAEEQAAAIIPNMREAIELIRELDGNRRPVWMNEARRSDVHYVRQYLPHVDYIGCDDYPVKQSGGSDLHRVGRATERWKLVGRGKPVWMVLQAFSWSDLERDDQPATTDHPAFWESRFMAYDVIAHGAKGILYWGSNYSDDAAFRDSLYALTAELDALQPFLVAEEAAGVQVTLIEAPDQPNVGVRTIARRHGDDWLVVLVNEDEHRHMGVEVSGLGDARGKRLYELYGGVERTVDGFGSFVTRMQPFEVQVFSTSRDWESDRTVGRDYDSARAE